MVMVSLSTPDYGYYVAYPKGSLGNPALKDSYDWLVTQAAAETPD